MILVRYIPAAFCGVVPGDARDARIGCTICRCASRASCKLVSFFRETFESVARLAAFAQGLKLRHDLRAWSSLRLGPKLSPSCARRVGRRDRLVARRPCATLLTSTSSPSVPDPLTLLRLSRLSSRARPSSYLTIHFTSSRHFILSHITLAVFTSSHHFTTIYVTSLR